MTTETRATPTPEPWEAYSPDPPGAHRRWVVRHSTTGNHPICDVFRVDARGEADARLLTAAPKLRRIVESLLVVLDGCGPHSTATRHRIREAREALRKATGE